MSFSNLLALALTIIAHVNGQYGPVKGPAVRRTTTPFPPGFQSDNQLYNSVPNSIAPDNYQQTQSYSFKDESGQLSGSFSSSSSGSPGGSSWWSDGAAPSAPSSGYGNAPSANKKEPAGAISQPDNPWLSGIIAQNSAPSAPSVPSRSSSCGYGGCSSSSSASLPSHQQTTPSVPCTTPGYVCVQKHQCQGGQTYSSGNGAKQCDLNTEICCEKAQPRPQPQPQPQPRPQPSYPPPPPPQQSYQPPPPPPPQQSYQPPPQPQPTYRPQPRPQPSYPQPQAQPTAQPQPTYQPRPQPQPQPQPGYPQSSYSQSSYSQSSYPSNPRTPNSYSQPSYQPGNNGIPLGGSIYDSGAPRPVPQRPNNYVTPAPVQPYTGPLNTTPYPGCAAALKCVEEIYCTHDGVMSDSPVYLTREQAENKVPLSECQNPETGIIGKCCRDPNYTDPWPAGMMMNGGGQHFDDGQYHEPTHQHQHQPQPQPQHQHQGTPQNNCGPSSTCTPQNQCPGERQTQPGKACQVPQDGSTGVCCEKALFPQGSNNQQINTSPPPIYKSTSALTPIQQYYTPKPQISNNPFLPENQGRLPFPQQKPSGYPAPKPSGYPAPKPNGYSAPNPSGYPAPNPSGYSAPKPSGYPAPNPSGYPAPNPSGYAAPKPGGYSSPTSYTQKEPNAITGRDNKGYPEFGKSSTPLPDIDVRSRPSKPLRPSAGYGQPIPQPSTLSPEISPQSYSKNLASANQRKTEEEEPTPSSSTTSPAVVKVEESNNVTPTEETEPKSETTPKLEEVTPLSTPESDTPVNIPQIRTRGKGPAPGYPFLAPTTEAPSIVRSTLAPAQPAPEPGKECGVRRDVPRPNGPAGLETGFGEFPWQAQVISSADQTPLCGGVIVSEKVVVTAAHCISKLKSEDLMIKAGDWKLGTENPAEEPKPVQIRFVAAIARHPKYDPVSQFNDVAVLILAEPLKLDSHVDVLCLGEDTPPGQKPRGTNCVVTGWGKANLQGNVPGSTMHSIPVNFIESEQCQKAFQNTYLGKYFQLHKSFVCALPTTPNHDLCQIDVGSPIACQKPDGRYELSGIYSWDVGCHPNTNVPAAASNVDKKWVKEVMNKPTEQVKHEENEEIEKNENLGNLPASSENKPGLSQGYGK